MQQSGHGWADGLACRVLEVYVRHHTDNGPAEDRFLPAGGGGDVLSAYPFDRPW